MNRSFYFLLTGILIVGSVSAQRLDTLIRASSQATDNAAWTPDGNHLLFTANFSGNWQVYIRNLTTKEVTRLTHHEGNDENPLCSPDGTKIIFSSERNGNQDLWMMDIDGKNQRKLLDWKSNEMHPTWHPNGQEILFNSNKDDTTGIAIYTLRLKSKEIKRLTNPAEAKTYAQWSPDGRMIAYVKWTSFEKSTRDICTMDPSGNNELNLTNNSENQNGWPSWSPDGKEIIFSSYETGNFQIYSISIDGKSKRRLIESQHDDRRAYWYKNHRKLAFDRTVRGIANVLFVAEFN